MMVPYNDPDAANCRLETIDDYVAFGTAAATTPAARAPSAQLEDHPSPKMRSRGNGFLGNLVLKKNATQAAAATKGGGGNDTHNELYGFEPEALDFVLTMVSITVFLSSCIRVF